eukprot:1990991-Rhodomonas_salina.1
MAGSVAQWPGLGIAGCGGDEKRRERREERRGKREERGEESREKRDKRERREEETRQSRVEGQDPTGPNYAAPRGSATEEPEGRSRRAPAAATPRPAPAAPPAQPPHTLPHSFSSPNPTSDDSGPDTLVAPGSDGKKQLLLRRRNIEWLDLRMIVKR